ncbi:MAG: isochorismatase family protein, partial [Gammaproteobacteria bacterium]|nr:isochorismatase family protein [Gammaproteobacteria bacterium]
MKPALLLIDIQYDFLQREELVPAASKLVDNVSYLLSSMRTAHVPIVHVNTIISPDGNDRMPHWKHRNYWACIEGSAGSQPPTELLPQEDEHLITKQFYSAFDSPDLHELLSEKDIDTVIVAGLYTHGCVRATILDAYAKGYKVMVASDAIASTEPEHSIFSQQWLEQRAANFIPVENILKQLTTASIPEKSNLIKKSPMAIIDGEHLPSSDSAAWNHHNPANHQEIFIQIPNADTATIDQAINTVSQAQTKWSPSIESRETLLLAWAAEMEK